LISPKLGRNDHIKESRPERDTQKTESKEVETKKAAPSFRDGFEDLLKINTA